jgi:hypothetical protein
MTDVHWFVGIVPPADDRRWWHALLPAKHKHAFMLRWERDNVWTLIEPWWTRIHIRTVDNRKARQFLEWALKGDLFLTTEDNPGTSTQIRGWLTCAALVAHVLGRPYHVWTPHALFIRLVDECHVGKTKHVDPKLILDSKSYFGV